MNTVIKILNDTSNYIKWKRANVTKNARDTEQLADLCVVTKYRFKESKDNVNRPCVVINSGVYNPPPDPRWASGNTHYQEVRLYPPFSKQNGLFAYAYVDCDCKDWLYRKEVATSIKGSTVVNYSDGTLPDITNPKRIAGSCKHVVAVLNHYLGDMATLKLGKQIEKNAKSGTYGKVTLPADSEKYQKMKAARFKKETNKESIDDGTDDLIEMVLDGSDADYLMRIIAQ